MQSRQPKSKKELMKMLTELLGKKEQGGQTQEASATGDEEILRAPAKVLCPSRLTPEAINLARVDAETTVSPVSPLLISHAMVVSNAWRCQRWYPQS